MRLIYDTVTKEVLTIIEEEGNSVTSYPLNTNAIIGTEDEVIKQAYSIDIDVSQIPSNMISPIKIKIRKREIECAKIKARYKEENATISIANELGLQILNAFSQLAFALDEGEAKAAFAIVQQMPEALFPLCLSYTTEAQRKQTYINELVSIITNPELFEQ